jgi:hypothetical protein
VPQDQAIKKLMKELTQKAEELRELYSALQTLKKFGASIELPDLGALVMGEAQAEHLSITPDAFYGLTQTEAAEKYLKMVGHAVPLEDIFSALVEGGVKFGRNGRSNLNMQMTRATRKFAKIATGSTVSFGLLEWYPSRAKKKAVLQFKVAQSENGEPEIEENEEIEMEEELSEDER